MNKTATTAYNYMAAHREFGSCETVSQWMDFLSSDRGWESQNTTSAPREDPADGGGIGNNLAAPVAKIIDRHHAFPGCHAASTTILTGQTWKDWCVETKKSLGDFPAPTQTVTQGHFFMADGLILSRESWGWETSP